MSSRHSLNSRNATFWGRLCACCTLRDKTLGSLELNCSGDVLSPSRSQQFTCALHLSRVHTPDPLSAAELLLGGSLGQKGLEQGKRDLSPRHGDLIAGAELAEAEPFVVTGSKCVGGFLWARSGWEPISQSPRTFRRAVPGRCWRTGPGSAARCARVQLGPPWCFHLCEKKWWWRVSCCPSQVTRDGVHGSSLRVCDLSQGQDKSQNRSIV